MEHQPVIPPLNEASANSDAIGGTLTSVIDSTFFSQAPGRCLSWDQMVDLPFPYCVNDEIVVSSSDTNTLHRFDPFQFLYKGPKGKSGTIPMPVVALNACWLYDYSVEVTLLIVKHERARGLFEITVAPGISGFDPTGTSFDPATNQFQKFLWDIEKSDTITFTVNAPKNFAWRGRQYHEYSSAFPIQGDNCYYFLGGDYPDVDPPISGTFVSDAVDWMSRGTFALRTLVAYNASNVGPSAATIIPFYRLVDVQTAEYRAPFGASPLDINFMEYS